MNVLRAGSSVEYASTYSFPCFTSDFNKTAQAVELIFTLERSVNLSLCNLCCILSSVKFLKTGYNMN